MIKHSRDYYIKQRATKFFVARFKKDPKHPAEKHYFNEWVSRFKTGVPENYMDNKSRNVYLKMITGKLKMPTQKVWKGKGGNTSKIIKVSDGIYKIKKIR